MTGIKTAITNSIKKRIGNITGDLARTGLIYAVSCKVVNPSFANQTKTKINNPELRGLAGKAFSEGFDLFSKSYPDEEKNSYDGESRTITINRILALTDVSVVDIPAYDSTEVYARNLENWNNIQLKNKELELRKRKLKVLLSL